MKKTTLTTMLIALFYLGGQSQTYISGNITNGDGDALPGVTVRIINTLKGTATNSNGDFVLKNIPGETIVVEYTSIGYKTKRDSFPVGTYADLKVVLENEVYLADALIVEATRSSDRTPMTFSNMDEQEIQEMNVGKDLPYVLNQNTSMVSTSDAGAGVGYTYLRMRGMDQSNINVTINGVALNDPESHLVFYVNLPDFASSLSDIQIQRGVGTSSNGAGAFGGSINMRTEEFNEDPYVEVTTSEGSFNTARANVKFGSGIINKYWTIDGRFSAIHSDGYIDRARSDLFSYFLSGGFNNGKTSVKLMAFGGREETYQAWYGVDSATLDTNRTFNFAGAKYDENWNINGFHDNEVDHYAQDHFQLHFNHRIKDHWRLNLAAHYTFGRGYFEQYRSGADLASVGLDPAVVGSDTIHFSDMVVRPWLYNHYYGMTFNLNFSKKKWRVDYGGAVNSYDGDHYGKMIWARYSSNAEPNHEFYRNYGRKNDFSDYIKVTKQFGEKLFVFGDIQGRYIYYKINGTDDFFGDLDLERTYFFINPKAGVTFLTSSNSDVYVSTAIANREPNRNDLLNSTNNDAQHETLYDTEAGYRWAKGGHALTANLFYMYYINQLVPTGQINDVGEQIRTNSGNSYRTGIELSAEIMIFKKLIYKPNLAYSENMNLDYQVANPVGSFEVEQTPIAYSPNVVMNNELKFMPWKFMTITLYSRYVGEQYLNNSGQEGAKLDPYHVVDSRIEYHSQFKWAKRFSIFANVFNMLNEQYVSNGYMWGFTPYYFPQAGINYMAGLSVRF